MAGGQTAAVPTYVRVIMAALQCACADNVRLPHATCSFAGSGQVIDQGARLVDMALEDGSAFKLDGWKYISESFAEHTLHFIGLLSDGGVHSRIDQLLGFVRGAAKDGAKRIRVHILTVRAQLNGTALCMRAFSLLHCRLRQHSLALRRHAVRSRNALPRVPSFWAMRRAEPVCCQTHALTPHVVPVPP